MSNIDTGGPAFPIGAIEDEDAPGCFHGGYEGMTLRDYFAATAVQGIVQCTGYATKKACMAAAECAYLVADAMLEARK